MTNNSPAPGTPQTNTKAYVALVITVIGAALTSAVQVIPDGTLRTVLTIALAAVTAAGTTLGVQQVANRPL